MSDVQDAQPALDVRHLGKSYPGFALQDVSFTLPRGYIMGLIGPNGAGKTTIIRAILGLTRPDTGSVRVLGLDAARDGVAVRARTGFVHEMPRFHEHLTLGAMARAVAAFYADWDREAFGRLADDFELPLRKRVYTLSHGTRTKFALALALAHRAELLVLDEPTSGLDPVFRRHLLDVLGGYIEDGRRSVLFSTHITTDLERLADFVTFVRGGRVVFATTRDEVLERWGVVKGGLEALDEPARRFFQGVEVTELGFAALTDNVEQARERFGGDVLVERPTLEDILYYMGRGQPPSPAPHGRSAGSGEPREQIVTASSTSQSEFPETAASRPRRDTCEDPVPDPRALAPGSGPSRFAQLRRLIGKHWRVSAPFTLGIIGVSLLFSLQAPGQVEPAFWVRLGLALSLVLVVPIIEWQENTERLVASLPVTRPAQVGAHYLWAFAAVVASGVLLGATGSLVGSALGVAPALAGAWLTPDGALVYACAATLLVSAFLAGYLVSGLAAGIVLAGSAVIALAGGGAILGRVGGGVPAGAGPGHAALAVLAGARAAAGVAAPAALVAATATMVAVSWALANRAFNRREL